MKLMDTFRQYHSELRVISGATRIFNRIEASTNVMGMTSIAHLTTLGSSVEDYSKQLMLFQNDPFEPAPLDDLKKAYAAMEQSLRIFEGTPGPDESDFDARCVLDLQALSDLIDIDFKCNVALKKRSQAVDFPRALIVFDLAVASILHEMCKLVTHTDKDLSSFYMTAKMPTESIISFKLLDEQKYFSDEENAVIRAEEEEKQKAIEEAKEKAAREAKAEVYIENLKGYFPNIVERIQTPYDYEILTRAMKVWDTISVSDSPATSEVKNKFEALHLILTNKLSYDILGTGAFTYGDAACLGLLMNKLALGDIRVSSFNLGCILDKPDDDRIVPKDDILDIVFCM